MTKQIKSKGFTIVELLIVIVVIAILAAITIVAYNGIQQRAKTTASKSSAETVQKKAEAANAIVSSYPASLTDFGAQQDSSLAGSGITFVTTLSSSSSQSQVVYQKCTTPASGKPAQQARVGSYDYSANTTNYVYLGGTADSDCTTWATALSGTPS